MTDEFTSDAFDSSSRAWLANKKRVGASYVYKCAVETCKMRIPFVGNCRWHSGRGIVLKEMAGLAGIPERRMDSSASRPPPPAHAIRWDAYRITCIPALKPREPWPFARATAKLLRLKRERDSDQQSV